MKNRIITALAVVGVLTTGAYAYGGFGNCDGSGPGMRNQQGMQPQAQNRGWGGNKMNKKRNGMMMGNRGGMQMFSQLNLTNDQQFQLSILRDEMRLEMRKIRGAKGQGRMMQFVSDNGFDNESFVKASDERHTKMLKIKSDHMEKVFKILTKEQVAQIKKNLNN